MKRFLRIIGGVLAMCLALLSVPFPASAASEEHILFDGSAQSTFRSWNEDWKEAVRLSDDDFDVGDFTQPFVIEVTYRAEADPYLALLSWTGGPNWVQMTPSYARGGVAYYDYNTLVDAYGGKDFSHLNSIRVLPSPSETPLTVTKVSWRYESDAARDEPQQPVDYSGVSGRVISGIKVGWNLGNTLDSDGSWISGGPEAYETAWNNPVTTPAMLRSVRAAGFNAVRVPVTWNRHIDGSNRVDEAWLDRVQQVVDDVLANGMYCIINLHHDTGRDGWLRASSGNVAANGEKFKAVWTQIAARFSSYGEKLLFEGFNEILDENNHWNYPGSAAGDAVNTLNQYFVDTVRATGGNNARRCLIVNTYAAGTESASLEHFVLPADSAENALIVEVHFYEPGDYCSVITSSANRQTVWTQNGGKSIIDNTVARLSQRFTSRGIPVIIGEFAAAGKDNEADRAQWAAYLVAKAGQNGIRCFWWDDGGHMEPSGEFGYFTGMALYDRYHDAFPFPSLVKAVTGVSLSSSPTATEQPASSTASPAESPDTAASAIVSPADSSSAPTSVKSIPRTVTAARNHWLWIGGGILAGIAALGSAVIAGRHRRKTKKTATTEINFTNEKNCDIIKL